MKQLFILSVLLMVLNHAFSYTVSGYVKKADGTPILNARIYVYGQSNSQSETYTNSSGYYSITIDPGWGGFLYCSKVGFTFTPADYAYSNVSQNYSGKNYTAVPVPVRVYGHVETYLHSAIQGVTMSGFPTSVVTGQDGNFETYVDYGWSGTVTPQKTGYSFNPQSVNLTNVTAETNTGWFTGTLLQYTVSGSVKNGSGTGIQGVTMNGLLNNPVTDVAGNYSVLVNYGWSGTVTPQKAGYTFSPASFSVSAVVGNTVLGDVTGNRTDFVISGYIKRANNYGVQGVTLSGLPGNPVTNSDGYYEASVSNGWSGVVKPSYAHGIFSPDSMIYSMVNTDITTDYIAVIESFTVSGTVFNQNGQPVNGVKISGFPFGDVFTNTDGIYSGIVEYGWSGTLTPEKTGYSFDPSSFQLSNVVANQQVNYTATALTFTLSGRVYDAVYDFGIEGVEMRGLPGVYTGYNGYYSLSGIQPGTTFTIEPVMTGVMTTPEIVTVTVNSDMEITFAAMMVNVTISGQVKKPDGTGFPNIPFVIPGYGFVATDGNGNYSIQAPYHYTGRFGPLAGIRKYIQRYYEINDLRQNITCNFQAVNPPAGISGAVFFDNTYEPLEGVTITDLNTNQVATITGADGNYSIAAVAGTNYRLKFEKKGYDFSGQLNITYSNPFYFENVTWEVPFIISGIVTEKGFPVEGVTLSASAQISATTGVQGYYSLDVPHHWSGTIIVLKPGYEFEPDTIVLNDVNDNQIINISANAIGKNISGYVVTNTGDSLQNAVVTAAGLSASTNASGFFNILVPDTWSGYVKVSLQGYHFSPDSIFIPSPDMDTIIHFSATQIFLSVSGFVRMLGDALQQVQITGLPHQTFTDALGFYTDTVPYGWSGIIKPEKTGYHFLPDSLIINNIINNTSIGFIGFINLYQISGMISYNGNPLSGILLTNEMDSIITDSLGFYSFTVPYGWNGAIVPSSQVYHFNPDTAFYTGVTTDLSSNFMAIINTYLISGHILTTQGSPVQQVTVSATDTVVYTDSAGYYSFTRNHGWNGILKPDKTSYYFTPDSVIVSGLATGRTIDFSADRLMFTVSGTVTDTAGNALSGIEINGFPVAVVTGENGYFSCVVEYGWSGVVTPQNEYFNFVPLQIDTVVQNNTAINFIGVPVSHEFSGRISFANNVGAEGVVIAGLPVECITDSNGNFNVLLPHRSSCLAVPLKAGLQFSPDTVVIEQVISDLQVNFTASIQMLTIRGKILCNGLPLPGVAISGSVETAYTNESGDYEVLVPYMWSGWLTPQKQGFVFSPSSLYFSNVTQNSFNNNFSGVAPVICGFVKLSNGSPVSGVILTGLPGNPVTDSAGFYISLAGANFTGTAVPQKAGYSFSPDTVFYNGLTQNDTTNYIATEILYTISGHITGIDSLPVANAAINGLPVAVMSDTTGFYSVVVRQGWSGILIPEKEGLAFTPAVVEIDSIMADTIIDFTSRNQYFTVSGWCTLNGSPMQGVEILGLPSVINTDSLGYFSDSVPYHFTGKIYPSETGYTFSPDTIFLQAVNSDTLLEFAGNPILYQVTGHITTSALSPVEGVMVLGFSDTLYTNQDGYFSTMVNYNWSGTLYICKPGYTFTPDTLVLTNVLSDTAVQIIATEIRFTISGTITLGDGQPLEGVLIQAYIASAITDSTGFYQLSVPWNFTGIVLPQKMGYLFEPYVRYYEQTLSDVSGQDYIAFSAPVISGTVTSESGEPLADVDFIGFPQIVYTNQQGFFSVTVPAGWSGVVYPVKEGYYFEPDTITFDSVYTDTSISINSNVILFQITGVVTLFGNPVSDVSINGLPQNTITNTDGIFTCQVPYGWSGMLVPVKGQLVFTPDTVFIGPIFANPDSLYIVARILQIPSVVWMNPDEMVIDNYNDVILQWSTDYPSAYYHLMVASDFDFSNVIVDTNYLGNSYFYIDNLTDGLLYFWKVAATGADGTGNFRTAFFYTRLKTPAELTVEPLPYDASVALLHWTDNTTNELGFIVEMKHGDSISSNTFEILDTLPAGSSSFEIYVGSDMGMFTFRVKAYNDLGESYYSNMAVFDTGNGVSINDGFNIFVQVYPNPASDFISFSFNSPSDELCSIELFNALGKKLYVVNNIALSGYSNIVRIPVNNWPNEEFIYLVKMGDKKAQGKFITR